MLDEPRRSINNTNYLQSPPTYHCDTSVTWSGWYRLFINGLNAHMPEMCVAIGHCDTSTTLWIRGGHPTVEDGVVTRDVCGHWNNYCCFFWSFPVKIKACPGNYYVYELIRPAVYCSGYCAGDYFYICCFHIFMVFVFCSLITIHPYFQTLATLTPAPQPSHQQPSQLVSNTLSLYWLILAQLIDIGPVMHNTMKITKANKF